MKTALQELIDYINDNASNWENETDCKSILSKATELLTKEREMGIKNVLLGMKFFEVDITNKNIINTATIIFNNNYKQ